MDKDQIDTAVLRTIEAKRALIRRGEAPGDAVVMAGLALGVLLAGERGSA